MVTVVDAPKHSARENKTDVESVGSADFSLTRRVKSNTLRSEVWKSLHQLSISFVLYLS